MLILLGCGNESLSDNLCFMPLCEHTLYYHSVVLILFIQNGNINKIHPSVKLSRMFGLQDTFATGFTLEKDIMMITSYNI